MIYAFFGTAITEVIEHHSPQITLSEVFQIRLEIIKERSRKLGCKVISKLTIAPNFDVQTQMPLFFSQMNTPLKNLIHKIESYFNPQQSALLMESDIEACAIYISNLLAQRIASLPENRNQLEPFYRINTLIKYSNFVVNTLNDQVMGNALNQADISRRKRMVTGI